MKPNYRPYRKSNYTFLPVVLAAFILLNLSCEPLATSFKDTEDAQYFYAKIPSPTPDTLSTIIVMTWNIRFGAGRIPWFGDACGDRVILTEDEVYASLQTIADKINIVKPDILLLQEVDLNSKRSDYIDQLQWLLDNTYLNYAVYGAQWRSQFIPSDGLGRMEEGNAILSRWKISDGKRIELGQRGDQDNLTRYFYERCSMVTGKIEIPGVDNLYAVNIHASAFATDDTKHKHIIRFKEELDRIQNEGGRFVAGGDLNTLPPGSDTTDYCMEDMCPGESYHHATDNPMHKEGSNYTPEVHWLDGIYAAYQCAVPTQEYRLNQYRYFSHTTRGAHFWDRTLDYLFTNYLWVDGSAFTHQDATSASDHAPVSATFKLPR